VSGRRKSSGGEPPPEIPQMPEIPDNIPALPSSGLASEILALLEGGGGAPAEPAPSAEWAAEGSDRLFSLADRLTRRGAAVASAPPEKPETWVTFEVAGEAYGLPVLAVEEVLRVTVITRLPYAPAPMRGITQLRGRVLPVVDLAVRLGAPPVEIGPHPRPAGRCRAAGRQAPAQRHGGAAAGDRVGAIGLHRGGRPPRGVAGHSAGCGEGAPAVRLGGSKCRDLRGGPS
jgi:hypothetical protein